MKGVLPLFLGIFGTFAFSWFGLTMVPNAQIGHLDPQVNKDDETDIYFGIETRIHSRNAILDGKVNIMRKCRQVHRWHVEEDRSFYQE